MPAYSSETKGLLFALLAMFLFSMGDGAYKYILTILEPRTTIAFGFGLSLSFLLLYAAIKRISLRPQRKRNLAVFSILFLIEQFLFLYALRHIPIAELFVVLLAAPVFVLAFSSLLLKEHLVRQEILAIVLGFAGALVVVATPLFSASSGSVQDIDMLAWGAAILNVVCNGSKILYLRKYCQTENSFALSVAASLLLAVVFGLQIDWQNFSLPAGTWKFLIGIGLASALGFIAYVRAFQMTKAALVSATQYSQIIWALLMGVFIFNEAPTPAGIISCCLILVSGYFLYLRKKTLPLSLAAQPDRN